MAGEVASVCVACGRNAMRTAGSRVFSRSEGLGRAESALQVERDSFVGGHVAVEVDGRVCRGWAAWLWLSSGLCL